ncbi:unnamed protein product, partial [Ixodes hexagonus]
LRFGEPIGEQKRPTEVFTTTFTNHNSYDVTHTVSQTHEIKETTTFTTSKGFNVNYTTGASVGVPGIATVGGGYSFTYNLAKSKSDSKTKTETLSINIKVPVPAGKTVQVSWYVTDTKMDFPWTADVTVRGWFAFWLKQQHHGHHLWFHPVTVLAAYDRSLTVTGPLAVTFEAEGVFSKVSTFDSRVFVYEIEDHKKDKSTTTRRKKVFRTP